MKLTDLGTLKTIEDHDRDKAFFDSVSLIRAIVGRAICDCIYRQKSYRRIKADAIKWVFDNSIKKWSFIWCCEQSDLCYLKIRKELLARRIEATNYTGD